MALATQCPHCHTTFRVAHDQLKLRAGLVRCGACKQIFNGIENLLPPQDQPAAPEPMKTARPESPPAQEPAQQQATPIEPPAADLHEQGTEDPLLRMTLVDFTHSEQADDDIQAQIESNEVLEKAIDDLQRKPWRSEQDDADRLDEVESKAYEEPSFVRQGRRRQRMGRTLRILMAIGLPVLLAALLAQAAYIFRNQLAALFPETKPALVAACELVGCRVGLPAQIESVSIESSELQAASADQTALGLSVLLRNHGAVTQAWPSIELTLNDANDKPIARRVFAPRDYLSAAQDIEKGFAPKSEQSFKLYLELSQLKASGYRVYLFYP